MIGPMSALRSAHCDWSYHKTSPFCSSVWQVSLCRPRYCDVTENCVIAHLTGRRATNIGHGKTRQICSEVRGWWKHIWQSFQVLHFRASSRLQQQLHALPGTLPISWPSGRHLPTSSLSLTHAPLGGFWRRGVPSTTQSQQLGEARKGGVFIMSAGVRCWRDRVTVLAHW